MTVRCRRKQHFLNLTGEKMTNKSKTISVACLMIGLLLGAVGSIRQAQSKPKCYVQHDCPTAPCDRYGWSCKQDGLGSVGAVQSTLGFGTQGNLLCGRRYDDDGSGTCSKKTTYRCGAFASNYVCSTIAPQE